MKSLSVNALPLHRAMWPSDGVSNTSAEQSRVVVLYDLLPDVLVSL
jgi:hypothetical protein